MQYRQLFFDLDHTLWDFEANSKDTLADLYQTNLLQDRGVTDFEDFFTHYSFITTAYGIDTPRVSSNKTN